MSKAKDLSKIAGKVEVASDGRLDFKTPLTRQRNSSNDTFTLLEGESQYGHASMTVGNGWGAVQLGDRAGSADNDWLILAHDNPNSLNIYGREDASLFDAAAIAASANATDITDIRPNGLIATFDPNGYTTMGIKPRYVSSWYSVTSDDQAWRVSHSLDPGPYFGCIQLAITGQESVKNQLGWPNIVYNVSDDNSSFAFNNSVWKVSIDDDLTYKGLESNINTTSTTRTQYTSSGYSFRVLLF